MNIRVSDYNDCIDQMIAAALEIAKDDPDLLTGEFSGFARVMWHDNEDRYLKVLGEDAYQCALQEAWHRVRKW